MAKCGPSCEQVKFEGEIREFADSLRNDARFHADSAEQLMKEVSFVLKQIDGRLPELFKTLPRTPYGLKPIPDYIAPQTTTAYYQPPPGDLVARRLLLRQHLRPQEPSAV